MDHFIEQKLLTGLKTAHQGIITRGNAFVATSGNENMGDGSEISFVFKTSSTVAVHAIFHYTLKGAGHAYILESPNYSGGQTGVQIPIYNRFRGHSNTGSFFNDWRATGVYENSGNIVGGTSGIAGGTKVWEEFEFSSTQQGGNENPGTVMWRLNTGTTYAFVLQTDAATNAANMELNLFEVK